MLQFAKALRGLLVLALVMVLAVPALAQQNQAATGSEQSQSTTGTIKSVTADQNQIIVTDKDGKDWTYHVRKDAHFFVTREENASLANLKAGEDVALLWEKGKGNAADRLETNAILVRTGDFKNAGLIETKVKSADDKTLTAMAADGKDMTFQMHEGGKIRLNNKEAKLNEVKANDRVIIAFERTGDQNRALAVCSAPEAREK